MFEDLIQTGVIKKVSKIYCEFHTQWLSLDYREREQKIREEIKNLNIPLEDWDALND